MFTEKLTTSYYAVLTFKLITIILYNIQITIKEYIYEMMFLKKVNSTCIINITTTY